MERIGIYGGTYNPPHIGHMRAAEYAIEALSLDRLLLKTTDLVPDGERQAAFVAVITLVEPDGRVIQARGEIHGELTREPKGENGFGYDPIFYYPPAGMTTAEMPSEEKNAVSHRGNALKVLYEKLKEAGYAAK